ncbi:Secreted protein [Paenibacillus lactis]
MAIKPGFIVLWGLKGSGSMSRCTWGWRPVPRLFARLLSALCLNVYCVKVAKDSQRATAVAAPRRGPSLGVHRPSSVGCKPPGKHKSSPA